MGSIRSVEVDEFGILGTSISPHETDPPLVVDADAALSLAVALQLLQQIPGRDQAFPETT